MPREYPAKRATALRPEPVLHDMDAEQATLGAILLDSSEIGKVCPFLKGGDFFDKNNRIIYSTMMDLYRDGMGINKITVAYRLRDKGQIDETYKVPGAITPVYFYTLELATPNLDASSFAKIVVDLARRREQAAEGQRMVKEAYNPSTQKPQVKGISLLGNIKKVD